MLSVFCFTSSADVCIYHFIDRFKQYEMLYEDAVLGGPRTSQYSPSVGEGHFLIYLFKKINELGMVGIGGNCLDLWSNYLSKQKRLDWTMHFHICYRS